MKRFLHVFLMLASVFCLTFGLASCGSKATEGLLYQMCKDADGNEYAAVVGLGAAWETDIVIPSTYRGLSVKEIGNSAFDAQTDARNATLTSITIPDSVISIGDSAFNACSSLTSIEIPDSVTEIGEEAFYGCSALEKVIISDLSAWCKIDFYHSISNPLFYAHHLYLGKKEIKELVIPNDITEIKKYAFCACDGLTNLVIHDDVTSIGNLAFNWCSGREHIEVADRNPVYRSEQDCLIERKTGTLILGCKNSVIPDGVTSIGCGAFSDCSGLTSITIPNSVTSIGDQAFEWCSGLTSITIPNSVTFIGNNAFENCTSLQSVTFENPNGWSYSESLYSSLNDAPIDPASLQQPKMAAYCLTKLYCEKYWRRSI